MDRGNVEHKVCPTLLQMANTGNRTQDLLILSPTPTWPYARHIDVSALPVGRLGDCAFKFLCLLCMACLLCFFKWSRISIPHPKTACYVCVVHNSCSNERVARCTLVHIECVLLHFGLHWVCVTALWTRLRVTAGWGGESMCQAAAMTVSGRVSQ